MDCHIPPASVHRTVMSGLNVVYLKTLWLGQCKSQPLLRINNQHAYGLVLDRIITGEVLYKMRSDQIYCNLGT
jgi:hypothetical protein